MTTTDTTNTFVLLLRYTAPLHQVDAALADHRRWLADHYATGTFLASGPQVPRTGGVILAQAPNRAAIEEITSTDPFTRAHVAAYDVVQFQPTLTAHRLPPHPTPSTTAGRAAQRPAWVPPVLVLLCGVLFASAGVASQWIPPAVPRLTVVALRLVIGGLVLAVAARPRALLAAWRTVPTRALLAAAAAMIGYQQCFFVAVTATGTGPAMAVAGAVSPLIAGLLGPLVGQSLPGGRWVAATAVALTGGTLMLLGGTGHVSARGVLVASLAGAGYALFSQVFPPVTRSAGPTAASALLLLLAGLVSSPALLALGAHSLPLRALAATAWLGLVTTAGAYALLARAMLTLTAERTVTLLLVQPLAAAALAYLLLGQRMDHLTLIGTLLLSGSALVATLRATERNTP